MAVPMRDVEVEVSEKDGVASWRGALLKYGEELKKTSRIAAPMVAVSVLQYLLQVISVMLVGHVNQLTLAGVAIATSMTNVTGFSLLVSTNITSPSSVVYFWGTRVQHILNLL